VGQTLLENRGEGPGKTSAVSFKPGIKKNSATFKEKDSRSESLWGKHKKNKKRKNADLKTLEFE